MLHCVVCCQVPTQCAIKFVSFYRVLMFKSICTGTYAIFTCCFAQRPDCDLHPYTFFYSFFGVPWSQSCVCPFACRIIATYPILCIIMVQFADHHITKLIEHYENIGDGIFNLNFIKNCLKYHFLG